MKAESGKKTIRNFVPVILTVLIFIALGCGETIVRPAKTAGYKLTEPDARIILPDTLREISGLTCIDSNLFACIQDENGILFIYDLKQNKIREQFTFNIDGDYEGICRVSDTIYILRSDGVLFEISD